MEKQSSGGYTVADDLKNSRCWWKTRLIEKNIAYTGEKCVLASKMSFPDTLL